MKVVGIIANNDIGLYNFRKELLKELIENEYEVHIILPYGDKVKEMERIGCIYHKVSMERRGTNPFKDFNFFLELMRLIKQIKPNILLTYTIKPNIYGGLVARLLGIAYISNITGLGTAMENPGILNKFITRLYKIALKKASCVFFQNKNNMEIMIQKNIVTKNNIVLLPGSGVNLEQHCYEEYPMQEDQLVFLFVGRLMKDKGIGEFIEAAKILSKNYNNICFRALGFCESEYETALKEKEADKYIELCGQQDNVHYYMKNAHAIVLPSYHEGMANVLLEAAATGRPILASVIPGCMETFDEGVSGIGFKVKSIDGLVEAIQKFMSLSYEEQKKMGQDGRKKMEQEFDRNIIIDAYMKEIAKSERCQ